MLYQFKSIYINNHYYLAKLMFFWFTWIYMDIYIYTCIYISCKIWVFWSSIRIESFFSAFLLYFYGVSWIYMDVCIYISCKNDVFLIIFFAIFYLLIFFPSVVFSFFCTSQISPIYYIGPKKRNPKMYRDGYIGSSKCKSATITN